MEWARNLLLSALRTAIQKLKGWQVRTALAPTPRAPIVCFLDLDNLASRHCIASSKAQQLPGFWAGELTCCRGLVEGLGPKYKSLRVLLRGSKNSNPILGLHDSLRAYT